MPWLYNTKIDKWWSAFQTDSGIWPELVLDFANQRYRVGGSAKTFSDLFSFNRASLAMLTDSDGLIKFVRHNYIISSEDLTQVPWAVGAGLTVTSGASNDSTGAATMTRIENTSGLNNQTTNVNQPTNAPGDNAFTYRVTFEVRSSTGFVFFSFWRRAGGARYDATVNLSAGTFANETSGIVADSESITYLGNNLYKIEVIGTVTGITSGQGFSIDVGPSNGTGTGTTESHDNGNYVDVGRFQLQRYPVEQIYLKTTNPERISEPRFDHDKDGNPLGLLIEESRTNSFLDSRDFTTANWSVTGPPVRARDAVGIDGQANTACTLTDDDAAGFEDVRQSRGITSSSNEHSLSIYIKKDTDQTRFPEFHFELRNGGTTVSRHVQVNTETGAFTVRVSAGTGAVAVEDAGNFWRLSAVLTDNATGNTEARLRIFPAATTTWGVAEASATGSIVVDQAQLERIASFVSSPIPTTTAAVTRAADNCALSVGNFGWSTTGAIFAEAKQVGFSGNGRIVGVEGAETLLHVQGNGNASMFNGSDSLSVAISPADNWADYHKSCSSGDGSSRKLVADGGTVSSDANTWVGTTPVVDLHIGSRGGSAAFLNGHIKVLAFYDSVLSDSDVQGLTA